jgi:hypothetical protein
MNTQTPALTHLNTREAAEILRMKPQTLRTWACYDNGPIRPIRLRNRLLWPRADIDKLLSHGS